MNQDQLKNIAEKYSQNLAGGAEKEALELFYKKLQEKNKQLLIETGYIRKNRILQNILKNSEVTTPGSTLQGKRIYLAIAGIVALLLTLSIFSGFFTSEKYIIYQTAKGEKRTITLTDGSRVTLNSNSTIKYPEEFGKTREVFLEGEAFFKVYRNPGKPFIVQTSSVKTRVLGTSFNINAYSRDEAMVSVNRGTVEVSMERSKKSVKLYKNEQVAYKGNIFKLSSGNSKNFSAWTEKIIVLQDRTLAEIANILENWYDVNIKFENSDLKKLKITGKFRDENLQNIFSSIELLKAIEIKKINQKNFLIREKTKDKN